MKSTLITTDHRVLRLVPGKNCALAFTAAAALLGSFAVQAEEPSILSLQTNRLLTWTPGDYTNGVAAILRSTSLTGNWSPFYYDVALYSRTSFYPYPYYTNVLRPVPRTTLLPSANDPAAFFRVALQTNVPDPSLLMHLSFDNDFVTEGVVLDVSGHNNHGLRYGRPAYPTNWPSVTTGPDGSQAAEFHYYADGWGSYGKSGDYVGIPTIGGFQNLPQTTMSFWCHYYGDPAGCNCNSTPLQAGQGTGSWTIGRFYDQQTTCEVGINESSTPIILTFPDYAPSNDTGGWHFYTVTFDHGVMYGYFDGTNCSAGAVPNQTLSVGGEYLSIAGWTFNETPWMDNTLGDKHPNNAWINGAIDDVRIYDRVLSPSEILSLYGSVDKQPPTTPANLKLKTDSSSQIELYWNPATDNFRVDGYYVRRNGSIVGTVRGNTHYIDTDLSPLTSYTYAVQAFDPGTNTSPLSAAVTTNTPASGSGVDVIVDNADGSPWVRIVGNWTVYSSIIPNFWGTSFLGENSLGDSLSVTYRPILPEAGNYQVYVWNPGAGDMSYLSSGVPVDIVHGGATNTVLLDEQHNFATWNFLGTYSFGTGTNGFVRLRTTGTGSFAVVADAVRFVK